MNIFALDLDPQLAARYHTDRHVVKMINESVQLLSNMSNLVAGRLIKVGDKINVNLERGFLVDLPKPTHWYHKCSTWVCASRSNAQWLIELHKHLCREYTFRYGKHHAYGGLDFKKYVVRLGDSGLQPFALAIPPQLVVNRCSIEQAVHQYRLTYLTTKYHLWKWTRREIPQWLVDMPMPEHDELVKIFRSRS